ncbi:MAG TPA: ATP-binding cassette domain-containing protein [Burkholderiales bacterium]|nr:ATP-binding cassette domain-containing protein [Burkholderiales bacterium]
MIRLEGARKLFHAGTADERAALDGVTLELAAGSFTVVIGSNGAGKSTLLNAIAGTVTLDAGSVRLDADDVTRWPVHRRARHVARVLQDPMLGTLPALTVQENLALAEMRAAGRGLRPALGAGRRARFAALLAPYGLGLESRLGARAGTLSGGQRQVLALAMAVIRPPRVLLLDEHAAALDPKTADLVMAATVRAVQAGSLTTLMVTHNMQHAIRYGDRLLMMDAGGIRLDLAGAAKRGLTVEQLVERFHLADDKVLLS